MYLNEDSDIYKAAVTFATAPVVILQESWDESFHKHGRVKANAWKKNNAIMAEWLQMISAKLQAESVGPGTSSSASAEANASSGAARARSRSPRR